MNCEFCDSPLQPGNQTCPGCGAAQSVVPPAAPGQPVQYAPAPAAQPGSAQGKSKVAAGVLGILLGGFGVHNFYLGYNAKAIIQLILGILGCFVGFTILVSSIWGLIEGIMILTGSIDRDGNGHPLI